MPEHRVTDRQRRHIVALGNERQRITEMANAELQAITEDIDAMAHEWAKAAGMEVDGPLMFTLMPDGGMILQVATEEEAAGG